MAVTTINIDSQVLTFANLAAFPITGTVKTIYIAEDTNFQYYWDGSQYVLLTTDINIPANLIFYATTAPSSVPGYERLVISPDDVDYDNPAVDVPTGAITTTAQLVGEQIADANIFAGNPGVINISTIGEIRRTSGTGTAEFYFEVYQRTSLGVETLIGTSNKTVPISGGVYQQFQTDCLFNNGTWLSTDRVVIKFYADRVAGGSNPNYDFLFGGANPVRTLFPISAQLLLNVPIAIGITGVTGGVTNQVLITDGSGKLGQSELKTVNSNSLLGSGDVSVGTVTSIATAGLLSGGTITSSGTITTSINTNRLVGRSTAGVGVMEEITIGSGLTLSGGTLTAAGGGITIGTTAIASGTVNRILFQGAGDVVQEDSTFVWNNTDKRLILGTEAVADTNSRLVVIGKGISTNTTFAVHNSTGTNNALVVRDDTKIGIGTATLNGSGVGLNIFGGASATHFKLQNSTTGQLSGDGFEIGLAGGSSVVTINQLENSSIDIYTNSILRSQFLANGNVTFLNSVGIGGTAPAATLEVRRAGANVQFFNTTNAGETDFYLAGNNAGGSARYCLFRFIANNFTNGGLYYLPNTTTTLSASVVFTATNNVLIGTTTDISTSILTINSTTKGVLLPRLTTAQKNTLAAAAPTAGTLIYDTTLNKLCIYTGAAFETVTSI